MGDNYFVTNPLQQSESQAAGLAAQLKDALDPSITLNLYNEIATPSTGNTIPRAYLLIVGTIPPKPVGQVTGGQSFLVKDSQGNNVWTPAVPNAPITWKTGGSLQDQFYPTPVIPGVHTTVDPLKITVPGNVQSCRVYFLIQTKCWKAVPGSLAEGDPRVFGPPSDPYRVNEQGNCNDFTAGVWGLNGSYPNFGGKCEFTVTASQVWMNTTNVDNFSLPMEFGMDVTPNASGSGTLPVDGRVGFASDRKALFDSYVASVDGKWWQNVALQGQTATGAVIKVVESSQAMTGITTSDLPSGTDGYLRIVSPAAFDKAQQGGTNDFQSYLNSVWTYWTGTKKLRIYGQNNSIWSGNASGDVFTFTLETPASPPSPNAPSSIVISKTDQFWWDTLNCTGPWVQVGPADDGVVKTNFSAALNRGIIPASGTATTFGPTELCTANPYASECNLYAKVLHEKASVRTLAPGGKPVSAVYAFPYDDSCDISTTISTKVANIFSASIGLKPWG